MTDKPGHSLNMNQNGHFEFFDQDNLKSKIPAAKTEQRNIFNGFSIFSQVNLMETNYFGANSYTFAVKKSI